MKAVIYIVVCIFSANVFAAEKRTEESKFRLHVNKNLLASDEALRHYVSSFEKQKSLKCLLNPSETVVMANDEETGKEPQAKYVFSADFTCASVEKSSAAKRIIHVVGDYFGPKSLQTTSIENFRAEERYEIEQ